MRLQQRRKFLHKPGMGFCNSFSAGLAERSRTSSTSHLTNFWFHSAGLYWLLRQRGLRAEGMSYSSRRSDQHPSNSRCAFIQNKAANAEEMQSSVVECGGEVSKGRCELFSAGSSRCQDPLSVPPGRRARSMSDPSTITSASSPNIRRQPQQKADLASLV